MVKSEFAQIPGQLYSILEPLTPEERARAVKATLILFGEEPPASTPPLTKPPVNNTPSHQAPPIDDEEIPTPAEFINGKEPKNKGEILALAAGYLKKFKKVEACNKAAIKQVITDADLNFDDANFARDIDNAKRQSAFFNTGTGRDHKLSYYGQQYIDALPNREKVAQLKRPKVGGNKKSSKKKSKN